MDKIGKEEQLNLAELIKGQKEAELNSEVKMAS